MTGLTDHKVESIIGNLLRIGVGVAGAVVFAGALIYLIRHGAECPNYQVFRGEPTDLTTLGGIWSQTLTGHGRGLIQLGLLVLIATPIARVAFSLIAFMRQRDRLYVGITLLVLVVLLYSLLGKAG
ncbi:MAG: DUF1634 domain-containing protein [Armatimonadia bacterium]